MRKRISVSKTGKRIKNKYVLIRFSLRLLVIIVFLYSGAVANIQAAELPDFSIRKDFVFCPGSGFFCPGIWGEAEWLSPPSDRYCINDTLHSTSLCILKISNPRYTKNPDDTLTIEFEYLVHDYSLVDYHYTSGHTGRVYLNVWIDWDGDKVWEPEEKVIHKCLFPNPSYLHVITISDTVPIPEKFTNPTWMRIYTSDMRDDKTEPCWLEGGIWGDVYDRQIYIEMPDLRINSSDISIEPYIPGWYDLESPPSIISVTVHNDGDEKAKHVEVNFVQWLGDVKLDKSTKILNEIPAGGSKKVSVEWPINPDRMDFIEVEVDPNTKIKELKEYNNKATTGKVTGIVLEKSDSINPLELAKIEFQQKIGGKWETKWVTFTNTAGFYNIITNMKGFEEERETRINCILEFSPDKAEHIIKIRLINDSEWGYDLKPKPDAKPISKSVNLPFYKGIYCMADGISFTPQEGGSVYQAIVNAYQYFIHPTVNFEPTDRIDVEVGDIDLYTSFFIYETNTIHIRDKDIKANMGYGKHASAHEYAHAVSQTWHLPYGPPKYNPENALDENWANFASCLARANTTMPVAPNHFINLEQDNIRFGQQQIQVIGIPFIVNYLMYSLADVWWDLDSRDCCWPKGIIKSHDQFPNNVVETLRIDHPKSTKLFYLDYRERTTQKPKNIKWVFRQHGYNTTGWPPAGPGDPDLFTDSFNDYKVDIDGDGFAEYLNIDVGLNLTAPGNYSVYGFLKDSGRERYCFAINETFLNSGINNVTLHFDGNCIFQQKLEGSLTLTGVYLADENWTEIDYRIDIYNTSIYNFTEFMRPTIYTTGTYTDYGMDLDGNGLYDSLAINVTVNVSTSDTYIIGGSLFEVTGNHIDDFSDSFNLSEGEHSVQIRFDGDSIYANRVNGSYVLKGPGISDLNEQTIYYDPITFVTNTYDYTQFQTPNGAFVGVPTVQGVDNDNDTLYDYLEVNVSLNITSDGDYSIIGHLANETGYGISTTNNYSYLSGGVQTLSLTFGGKTIRRNRVDGPYVLTISLYDDSHIDKITYTTSLYNYTEFQIAPADYFDITYADYGADPDGNGLYDYLTVDMNVSTIKPGNYVIRGYLYDENDSFVAHDAITSYIDEQPRRVQLNFIGQRIWSTHILNGNYTLELLIYDDNSTRVAELMSAYVTSPYDYTEFEGAYLQSVSDYGVDRDNNGLYEQVVIEALIGTNVARNVTVKAELSDANENKITAIQNLTYVDVGTQPVLLHFDGVIFKNSMDGSYNVELVLKDEDDNVLDSRSYETSVYNSSDFQRLIELTGYYSDNGTDLDGDGFFDNLTIDIGVFVTNFSKPLNLSVTRARLVDHRGEEIARAENTTMLQDDDQTILLSFNGTAIYEHRVAGPYYLRDVYIYHTAEPHDSDFARDAYTTKAYNYSDFGENLYLPPVADADGPYAGFDWQPITFDGSRSYDPEGMPLTYYWDFGDGTNGTGVSLTHIYAQEGTYNVSLIVRDATQNSTPYTTTATIEKGTFLGETSDSGVDTDSDGLYNFLSVEVQITSLLARDIILKVKLFDGQGNLISETQGSNNLDVGSYLVTIDFDGSTVFGHGEDGPYIVGLVLEDVNEKVLDNKNHTTSAYNYTDFQL
jgi:hypothetical protein